MQVDEAAVINYASEFYRNRKVSDATFQAALQQFGTQHLVELTALMGHYGPNVLLPQRL